MHKEGTAWPDANGRRFFLVQLVKRRARQAELLYIPPAHPLPHQRPSYRPASGARMTAARPLDPAETQGLIRLRRPPGDRGRPCVENIGEGFSRRAEYHARARLSSTRCMRW